MRVLIAWADDVSPNLGVRALGRGSIDLLSAAHPDAEFEVMNYGSRPAAIDWSPRTLLRRRALRSSGMMDWLASFDLFWDTRSGDSFADIYGLDRHLTMSLIHEFAAQAGVRCVMAPQTIGPFATRRAAWLATRTLKRSHLVFARDPRSAEAAAALGRPVDALTTDLVFAIAPPGPDAPRDVVLNVSGLLWEPNPHVDYEEYRRSVRLVIEGVRADGRSITLMPHVLDSSSPDSDLAAARAIHADYDGEFELFEPESLDAARGALAAAQVVVGARMHACLNALSTGTPAVAMAYSRKFRPLLAELGWDDVVEVRDASSTSSAVLSAIRSPRLAERARDAQAEGRARIDRLRSSVGALA
ncbi:polysaccharide pyruvyl transferase family protein [Leucobacter triazinivorans]|uniref:polysaccharide pyruvyl transferase family protein n=1 Tax=Leucobacter triazinivorans TaxID=1784719 RepID=UPI001F0DFF96|nr:polysaccharide pyruvyl transferase family protein [Leucobacter triazinivorans]